MTGNEWERFGREIRKTIQDAIESQDYRRLNQTVAETLDRAMNATLHSVSRGMDPARRERNGGSCQQGQNQKEQVQPVRKNNSSLYKNTTGARAAGIVLDITGGVLAAGFGCTVLGLLLAGALSGFSVTYLVLSLIFFLLAASGAVMLGWGMSIRRMEKRFRRILQGMDCREYYNVEELAALIGRPEEKTARELGKMTARGWFRQGHFDETGKCFITSDRMYQEYVRLNSQRKAEAARFEERRRQEVKRAEDMNSRLSPEARRVIEEGDDFVRKIRLCNDNIPGEEISAKISHMEMIVDRIFDRVEQNPEEIPEIRRLMEYYLPTTIKLLEAYQELDAQPVAGENIQTSKREIEATLDTLNDAFEKILDDLFHRTAWDVSSDISVLNTLLAQEGLKEDGMRQREFRAESRKGK